MMTKSTVAIWPMAITSPRENEGNSNSDFMKQNSNINIDDSPTNDKPEWRYNQERPNNISPSTTASSHNLYYHQSSPTLPLLSYIDSEGRRDFSNPLIYLPFPLLVTRTLLKKLRAILWFPTRSTLFHAVLFILYWTCTWERVNVSFFPWEYSWTLYSDCTCLRTCTHTCTSGVY